MAQGKLEEAQALLEEHREHLRKFAIRGGIASSVIMDCAAASLVAAEQSDGAARDARLKEAGRTCRAAFKQAKWTGLRSSLPAALTGTFEWLRGRPRKAEKWWVKSLDHAEKLGARYEGALTRLGDGPAAGRPGALEKAAAAFEDMGAEHDLAQAMALQQGLSEGSPSLASAR